MRCDVCANVSYTKAFHHKSRQNVARNGADDIAMSNKQMHDKKLYVIKVDDLKRVTGVDLECGWSY